MIERFWDAGHRVGRVRGDEVHGGNPRLRAALEERGIGYVLAVACSAEMATGAGTFRADVRVKKVTKRAWQKVSAGRGAKGQRFYEWAVLDLVDPMPGSHQLLIRRNRTTGELAYYRCHSTEPVPLTVLVKTAGSRWRVEETFQAEKGLAETRRAPGPPLPLLDPLGHPRDARPRLPPGGPCRRTHPHPRPGRPGPAVLQRDPVPVHHPHRADSPRHGLPARLVAQATATSAAITHQPLPATSRIPDMKVTIYGGALIRKCS